MDHGDLRDDMVDGLEARLHVDADVALAMRTVPRHEFADDAPYHGQGETAGTAVLAPETAARLLTALDVAPDTGDADPTGDVLVVGAGVGYTAALLAEIVGEARVHAVDIDRQLVHIARSNLESAGYPGVLVDARDGAEGLPAYAPFDRVLVEAAAIDPPGQLVEQLAFEGRLVLPLGGPDQTLTVVDAAGEVRDRRGPVAFRPLLVDGEQASRPARNRTVREDRERSESDGYFADTGWEQEWIDWDDERTSGRRR